MKQVSREWANRGALPSHVVQMLNNFPAELHPMSQFSAAITAMQSESKFARAYAEGVNKAKYWQVINLSINNSINMYTDSKSIICLNFYRRSMLTKILWI